MSTITHNTVIIGAGFSGIGAAIQLDKAGFDDFLMIEDGDGVGGAWHWNTYPGVGVDIPSFSYQFSFEQRNTWSRVYAPGAELKAYAEHCMDKYRLRERTRFNTRVTGATFDDDSHEWTLTTSAGDEIVARNVVVATGVLTQPKLPDIPGVESFAGDTLHTARWDHDVDLTGKRVAIIGTGASAVQVIPTIAPEVEQLTVFQRTPIWCLPKPDARLAWPLRAALRVPGAKTVTRTISEAFVEANFPIAAHFYGVVPLADGAERIGKAFLRQQVKDPVVREKLTPKYGLGCKRPSFSNKYLPAFNRDNVLLETSGIEAITPTGVRTVDGVEHEVDVLILATGFKVFEKGNMPPIPVSGANGLDLEAWWDENRFQAYQGVSMPGFPNLFMMLGPYGFNGSSYFNLIEAQSRHIVRALREARRRSSTRVEVSAEANDAYFQRMLGRRGQQVFFRDACATANSYYFDAHGDVPLRPALTVETKWEAARYDLDDYTYA
ncbi:MULTISPECIES: flavin-containing monooxygenase [unclassified Nocardioides]|uniref:flavin-containing monooxygenase n=1 Tax=unclassified Nocardioides TaxID=2615069 RepID=UPI0006FED78A|nr:MULTISPECIES: NAD(P)/FAD-dependent oxidoreductase [unclassified Nocardioides]KRA32552.1 monooxygenase [Nocardioides sp. Root614]KRA89205.1 monooxygenase [Nocardioides sp. Root682]